MSHHNISPVWELFSVSYRQWNPATAAPAWEASLSPGAGEKAKMAYSGEALFSPSPNTSRVYEEAQINQGDQTVLQWIIYFNRKPIAACNLKR